MRILALAALLFVGACGHKSPTPPAPRAPIVPDFKIGDRDPAGRLIFWSIDAYDHNAPFILREDEFGTLLFNDGTEKAPKAGYILAFQNTGDIVNTNDFAVFKLALAKVPRGSVIGRYNTCTMSRSFGLPESVVDDYFRALAEAGLQVEEENRCVCYCPNGGY